MTARVVLKSSISGLTADMGSNTAALWMKISSVPCPPAIEFNSLSNSSP